MKPLTKLSDSLLLAYVRFEVWLFRGIYLGLRVAFSQHIPLLGADSLHFGEHT